MLLQLFRFGFAVYTVEEIRYRVSVSYKCFNCTLILIFFIYSLSTKVKLCVLLITKSTIFDSLNEKHVSPKDNSQ